MCEARRHPRCHSSGAIHLVLLRWGLFWPGPCQIGQASWPVNPRDPPVSASSLLGLQVHTTMFIFVKTWFLEIDKANAVLTKLSSQRVLFCLSFLNDFCHYLREPSTNEGIKVCSAIISKIETIQCVIIKDLTGLLFLCLKNWSGVWRNKFGVARITWPLLLTNVFEQLITNLWK